MPENMYWEKGSVSGNPSDQEGNNDAKVRFRMNAKKSGDNYF
jgi:hypothetical protein